MADHEHIYVHAEVVDAPDDLKDEIGTKLDVCIMCGTVLVVSE